MTTIGDLERLHRLEKAVIAARAGGHTDLLAKVALLLGDVIRLNHPDPAADGVRPDRRRTP